MGQELLLLVAFKFFKFKLCFLLTFLAWEMSKQFFVAYFLVLCYLIATRFGN